MWGPWSTAFKVTAPIDTGPVVTPVNSEYTRRPRVKALRRHRCSLTAIHSAAQPPNMTFGTPGGGGGYFALNGTALGANQNNIITAAQLSQLTYQVGSGTDTLWVEANDGTVWGPWSNSFTISDPSTIGAGATLELASAFSGECDVCRVRPARCNSIVRRASPARSPECLTRTYSTSGTSIPRTVHTPTYSGSRFRRHAHCDGRYPQRQHRFVRATIWPQALSPSSDGHGGTTYCRSSD